MLHTLLKCNQHHHQRIHCTSRRVRQWQWWRPDGHHADGCIDDTKSTDGKYGSRDKCIGHRGNQPACGKYEQPKEWQLIPESEQNMCESVSESVPMQIMLGMLCIILPVRRVVANCWKIGYFLQPHECSHALWAHNLIREYFWYCLLAFLQHVILKFSYFVHV